jgi:hypothetical protein
MRMRGSRESREASEQGAPQEALRARRAPAADRAPAAEEPIGRRRAFAGRSRNAGAAAVGTAGAGVIVIARLVMSIALLIALLIAAAIVLRDVDANSANTIVKDVHEGANFFAGAFTGIIVFHGHPKRALTVDWGIALIAYLVAGSLIARVIRGLGMGGVRYESRHRPAL